MEVVVEDVVLIPTGFKSKLPHTLSYPIGAEVLSSAFADVPQFSMFTLDFLFFGKARPDREKNYCVLEIAYHRRGRDICWGKDATEKGLLEPKWTITVRPVPQNRRHLIKIRLQSEALPLARKWLLENPSHDEEGGLTLTFSFDEETELLSVSKSSWLSPRQSE